MEVARSGGPSSPKLCFTFCDKRFVGFAIIRMLHADRLRLRFALERVEQIHIKLAVEHLFGLAECERWTTLEDALLEWPLPPGEQAYGRIDGRHLHRFVEEQAAISRRYRDQGHPKFWGRIIGTSADAESAEWLASKFRSFGMSDVRIQPLDLS